VKVRIVSVAMQHIRNAIWFYETQNVGLGHYFYESIREDIDRLAVTGGTHRVIDGKYHRAGSRNFPFGIYYTFDRAEVTVHAVLDSRRDPSWIEDHLR
jgi:hypothetical protein